MTGPTQYVPKCYHPRLSTFWWVTRWAYLKFILREISSIFVAWTVVLTLLLIRALKGGPADYAEFQKWLVNPFVLTLDVISFFFVVFHAVTWFNLAPKAMAVRLGGKRLPPLAIALPNYAAWLVVSGVVFWVILRG